MSFAINTTSGKDEVLRHFRKHYEALQKIQGGIDQSAPSHCCLRYEEQHKKQNQQKKKKKRQKKRQQKKSRRRSSIANSDILEKTMSRVKAIKTSKNSQFKTSKRDEAHRRMITQGRKMREKRLQREHELRLKKMNKNIRTSHCFSQRKKNYYDTSANPVKLFRRKQVDRPGTAPDCLMGSTGFLGKKYVTNSLEVVGLKAETSRRPSTARSRPATARTSRRRSMPAMPKRPHSSRRAPRSARSRAKSLYNHPKSARTSLPIKAVRTSNAPPLTSRNKRRPSIDLEDNNLFINDEVLEFQKYLVDTIVHSRQYKEDDILNFVSDEITKHLHFSDSDLLQVSKFVCTEFNVKIQKLHMLLSQKLQPLLESPENSQEREPPVELSPQKKSNKINIPRPKNEETLKDLIASPEWKKES